ncbi:hypothetical protein FB45DRAFT_1056078, partial [Roridomyces roridus]
MESTAMRTLCCIGLVMSFIQLVWGSVIVPHFPAVPSSTPDDDAPKNTVRDFLGNMTFLAGLTLGCWLIMSVWASTR